MLTPIRISWAAGFLEGEGHFRFQLFDHKTHRGCPLVTASQVQREPLDRLRLAFGGSIYWHPKHGRQGIHSWRLNGRPAIGLMMTLYSMMSPRRQSQIAEAIQEWRRRPGSGISNRHKTHCLKGHPFDAANTIRYTNAKRTHRFCRTCLSEGAKERRRLERQKLDVPELPL